jgi:hypothetical protein
MNRTLFCLTAFLVVAPIQVHGEDDPVRAMLDNAVREYEESLAAYRDLVHDYFAKRDEAARKDGNKKLIDQINAARDGFEATGELPATAPATLRSRPASALATLTLAYKQAVKEYVRTKQDDRAAAAEQELAAIKAKAGFPLIAGTWQEGPPENGIVVAIRQEADQFTATCTYVHESHGEISWRMRGVISKEGAIRGKLIHTKAPPGWQNQTRIGKFSFNEGTIVGRAEFQGGGAQDFAWALVGN